MCDFRDEERGVMLVLRNALTGVDMSSLRAGLGIGSMSGLVGRLVVLAGVVETASFGVTGVFAVLVEARAGMSGRPLLVGLFDLFVDIVA